MLSSDDFTLILEELQRKPLGINKYRRIAGEGNSNTFGLVNRRCLPPDYSRLCWKRPYLYKLLLEFGEKHVKIPFTSITVNENYKANPHKDKGNKGESYLCAFGNFQEGQLKIHEGPLTGLHSIKHTPLVTDFSKVTHSVEPWDGDRYSLVYYTIDDKGKSLDIPKGSVELINNKYVFKRGEEVIRDGLPHPLKDKKKSLVIEHKPVIIEFN